MTRLMQVDGEGNLKGEVKSFDPISGVYDAVRIATQQGGDGRYWVDFENGKYYEFDVEGGQAVSLTEEGWREGSPGEVLDNSDMENRVSRPASEFGGFFLDDEARAEIKARQEAEAAAAAQEAPVEEPAPAEAEAEEEAPAAEEAPTEEPAAEETEEPPAEAEAEENKPEEAPKTGPTNPANAQPNAFEA